MASDGVPANPPVTRPSIGSQAAAPASLPKATGKTSPPSGLGSPPPAEPKAVPSAPGTAAPAANDKAGETAAPAKKDADLKALIAHLNKSFNDSGQPNQFRVAASSAGTVIQEVNPSTGEVIGQYSTAEFPALARGLDASGLVIDSHA